MSAQNTFNRQSHVNCVFRNNSKQLTTKQKSPRPTGELSVQEVKLMVSQACHCSKSIQRKGKLCSSVLLDWVLKTTILLIFFRYHALVYPRSQDLQVGTQAAKDKWTSSCHPVAGNTRLLMYKCLKTSGNLDFIGDSRAFIRLAPHHLTKNRSIWICKRLSTPFIKPTSMTFPCRFKQ